MFVFGAPSSSAWTDHASRPHLVSQAVGGKHGHGDSPHACTLRIGGLPLTALQQEMENAGKTPRVESQQWHELRCRGSVDNARGCTLPSATRGSASQIRIKAWGLGSSHLVLRGRPEASILQEARCTCGASGAMKCPVTKAQGPRARGPGLTWGQAHRPMRQSTQHVRRQRHFGGQHRTMPVRTLGICTGSGVFALLGP